MRNLLSFEKDFVKTAWIVIQSISRNFCRKSSPSEFPHFSYCSFLILRPFLGTMLTVRPLKASTALQKAHLGQTPGQGAKEVPGVANVRPQAH